MCAGCAGFVACDIHLACIQCLFQLQCRILTADVPQKHGFRLYLCVECTRDTPIRLTVETENRVCTKNVVFHPGTKQRCIPFRVYGRRFRLRVESDGATHWQLLGGMQMEMDTEVD